MNPVFVHDPRRSAALHGRFSSRAIPTSTRIGRPTTIEYVEDGADEAARSAADAGLLRPDGDRFQKQFRKLTTDAARPIDEYIDLPAAERAGKTPFVWSTDDESADQAGSRRKTSSIWSRSAAKLAHPAVSGWPPRREARRRSSRPATGAAAALRAGRGEPGEHARHHRPRHERARVLLQCPRQCGLRCACAVRRRQPLRPAAQTRRPRRRTARRRRRSSATRTSRSAPAAKPATSRSARCSKRPRSWWTAQAKEVGHTHSGYSAQAQDHTGAEGAEVAQGRRQLRCGDHSMNKGRAPIKGYLLSYAPGESQPGKLHANRLALDALEQTRGRRAVPEAARRSLKKRLLDGSEVAARQPFVADGVHAIAWEFQQEELGAGFTKVYPRSRRYRGGHVRGRGLAWRTD